MRVAVFQPEFRGFAGHTHQEALGWRVACASAGIDLALFSHRDILPEAAVETGARPCFGVTSEDLSYFSCPDVLPEGEADIAFRLVDYLIRSRAHGRDCAAAWAQMPSSPDLVILPWSNAALLNGAAEWLSALPVSSRPAVAANIIMPEASWTVNRDAFAASGEFAYLRLAARRMQSLCRRGFLLTAVDRRLARLVMSVTTIACAPSPLPQFYGDFGGVEGPRSGCTIALLGMPRPEKGSGGASDLVEAIAHRHPSVRFNLHARGQSEAARMSQSLSSLAVLAKVSICTAPISRAHYLASLKASDLVLLPYDATAYAMRASGVFADALAMACPVIVPARTWLSDRLAEGWGAGEIFDPSQPSSVLDAVERALGRLGELRTASVATYDRWRKTQSVEAYFHQILEWYAAQPS